MPSPDRVALVAQLVSQPDPFDCWRRHHITQPGDPQRQQLIDRQRVVYHAYQVIARENGQ